MTPTLNALDPAVFPADVQAFAAARGVTDDLVGHYELAKECFPGADITTTCEVDGEEPGLSWIVFQVVRAPQDSDARHAAYSRYIAEEVRRFPPAAREPFAT